METQEERNKNKRAGFRKDDTIGRLDRRMYSRERKGFLPWRKRREAKNEAVLVPDDWQASQQDTGNKAEKKQNREGSNSGISALLIFSIIFFILAGIGAFMYLRLAVDTSSAEGVDIAIEGSTSLSAGDVLELQVLVTNRNETALELADLVVTYPEGAVSPADFRTPLKVERIPLGLVEPRSARRGAVRAMILGNNGELKNMQVELQYRQRGSNAIYSRITSHAVLIATDALSVRVDANKELTPGQSVPMSIIVKSHASTILSNVYLDVTLPFGFTMVDSAPKPDTFGHTKNRWLLGTLRPGEERMVQLSGTLDGQAGDVRTLGISAGSGASEANDPNNDSGTTLATAKHSIEVRRPFLQVVLESRGESLDAYTANSGTPFDVVVKWHNNLTTTINDATVAITLGGSALNKAGVDAGQNGFYRSVDSLLLWDAKTSKETLKTIAPGASGEFKFKITPLPQNFLEKIRTPSLSFAVHAAGKRLSEQGVPEVLKEEFTTEVKVATDSLFRAYGLFKSSPFGVLGPLPPKVEYETTYGIVWQVENTTSDIKEAIVKAELPHYVRWVGLTTPANEQLIYNKANNTIEWNLGTVKAGTGVSHKARTVSFALGLVPSATQIGKAPELVRNQTFEAIDMYTDKVIKSKIDNVDTKTERDVDYDSKDSRVVK